MAPPKKPPSFLDLPAEVRKIVYMHHFTSQPVIVEFNPSNPDPDLQSFSDPTPLPHSHTRVHPSTNIFPTNKTIYLETQPLLFHHTTFEFIDCPWLLDGLGHNTACICLSQRICHQIQRVTFRESELKWAAEIFHPFFINYYAIMPRDVLVIYERILPFDPDTRKQIHHCCVTHLFWLTSNLVSELSNFRRALHWHLKFELSIDITFRADVVFLRLRIEPDQSMTILERNVHCTDNRLSMIKECYLDLETEVRTADDIVVHREYDEGWGSDYGPASYR